MATITTSSVEIATLRNAVRGSVLAPGDDGWDEARTPWNVHFDQQPALIVVPANSADVQAAVRFAVANGLRVAPQGTGHGVATLGDLSDAILVRMHELRDVRDRRRGAAGPRRRRRHLGGGRQARGRARPRRPARLLARCRRRRLHARRRHGLARPQARPGRQLGHGDRGRHGRRRVPPRRPHARARPLLRAARRRRQLRRRHGARVRALPARAGLRRLDDLAVGEDRAVLSAWRDWTETTPDEVTSVGRIFQFPPIDLIPEPLRGRNLVVVEVAYMGDEESGRELVKPLHGSRARDVDAGHDARRRPRAPARRPRGPHARRR